MQLAAGSSCVLSRRACGHLTCVCSVSFVACERCSVDFCMKWRFRSHRILVLVLLCGVSQAYVAPTHACRKRVVEQVCCSVLPAGMCFLIGLRHSRHVGVLTPRCGVAAHSQGLGCGWGILHLALIRSSLRLDDCRSCKGCLFTFISHAVKPFW